MDRGCLVFDFDGTILDTEEPIFRSWAELWSDHGLELSRAEWQGTIGTNDGRDPWEQLEHRLGRSLDPALARRRRQRRDHLQAAYEPRAGVVRWLAEARRIDVPVAVASSSSLAWVEGHLHRLGLSPWFDSLVCCDSEVPPKPDPTSYRLACGRLRAQPSMSVAVEDSPHGVAAATGAGLFTVAVPHGLTAELDLSAADVVAESLDSLRLTDVLGLARDRGPAAAAVT